MFIQQYTLLNNTDINFGKVNKNNYYKINSTLKDTASTNKQERPLRKKQKREFTLFVSVEKNQGINTTTLKWLKSTYKEPGYKELSVIMNWLSFPDV